MDNPHALRLNSVSVFIEVVGLQEHHVAAITTSAIKESAGGCAGLLGCDNLKQLIANRVEAVSETKV
jgi:hypothetical protein